MTFAMTTYESLGWASQFGTKDEVTWATDPGAATQRFLIDGGGLAKFGAILERDALRGDRSAVSEDTRQGPYTVSGTIQMRPTPEDLAIWLPRILGGTPSGTSYTIANVLPSFRVDQDIVAKVNTYLGCKVDKATFSFRKGDFMRLSMDICGKSETTATGGGFPSLTGSITTPFVIYDGVLTLLAAARTFDDCEIVINNNLTKDNFKNSNTVVALDEGPRMITVRTSHAYNLTNIDLYNQALAGAAGTLVLTLGNYSMTFTFGTLQVPDNTPKIQGKEDIPLILEMTARKLSTAKEIAVTLDSTG